MTVRLIVFTLAILSLVNAYSFVKLYSTTTVTGVKATPVLNRRGPASIPPLTAVPIPHFKTKLAYDLNCGLNKKIKNLKMNGQWAQLKGRVCDNKKLKKVEITNLNNGFTASIFDVGVSQYQTDLIQLDQGTNKIRVRITPLEGSAEEQTVVIENQSI